MKNKMKNKLVKILTVVFCMITLVTALVVPISAEETSEITVTITSTTENRDIWDDWVLGNGDPYHPMYYYYIRDQHAEWINNVFTLFSDYDVEKTVIEVEHYQMDNLGNNLGTLYTGFKPVTAPSSLHYDKCFVGVLRMNEKGQLYWWYSFAENFNLSSKNYYDCDDYVDLSNSLIIEYDVVADPFEGLDSEYMQYFGILKDCVYWDRSDSVYYRRWNNLYPFGGAYGFGGVSEENMSKPHYGYQLQDTMRNCDTNDYNYTLAFAIVSLDEMALYQNCYDEGLAEGFEQGQAYGENLHADDYQNGFADGEALHADDYQNGYDAGEAEGWKNGEAHGITETGNTLSAFKEMVFAIFDAPVSLIDGMLNFDIFGINMAGLVKTIITLAVVALIVFVILKFAKE